MNVFQLYFSAKNLGLAPILLDNLNPSKPQMNGSILALKPKEMLEVYQGKLYVNGETVGPASELFSRLTLFRSKGFFPAWIGFFSYEFAGHLGMPTKDTSEAFPEAHFALYDDGFVWQDGKIIHKPGRAIECLIEPPVRREIPVFLNPAISRPDFIETVLQVKKLIELGEVYQVNLAIPFHFDLNGLDLLPIYDAMRQYNPSPFMGLMEWDDWSILCGSPEKLFSLKNQTLTSRPIAGTRPRGMDGASDQAFVSDLTTSKKENAEHAMLVDLIRNDLAVVCKPGSVTVPEDRTVEFYSHVMHLVSEVRGVSQKPFQEIFRSIFPAGTITGAPKIAAMETIRDLEPFHRGPYTGSMGYISSGFGANFNIMIRSIFAQGNKGTIYGGAGIVRNSDPEKEWQEIHKKVESVQAILSGKKTHAQPRSPLKQKNSIFAPGLMQREKTPQVLFVENNDSFSHNIIHYLIQCGAQVECVANNLAIIAPHFTHVVIGPGPGTPSNMPKLRRILSATLAAQLPLLGLCLGHQAIGYAFGAAIVKAKKPIHGEVHAICHHGQGLFAGIPTPCPSVRYHSLVIDRAPEDFIVDAWSEDDHIMAIRHKNWPIFGIQFHPESYLSQYGPALFHNFLDTRWS